MNPLSLAIREILHRRSTSFLTVLLIAVITGTITFFVVNSQGFEKEVGRNVRDIGSNIVILPADTDQFVYHQQGGINHETMPYAVVDQLVEFRASLNHLIPMLERKAQCQVGGESVEARVVGLVASIPVPGRPKAPMQKAIPPGKVQLGEALAKRLKISREDQGAVVAIEGRSLPVARVNRSNGTWQDSAVFVELSLAQELFELQDRITRIEAIECTQEKCEETGLQSNVVLANELARITDQAVLLRRDQMATARRNVRALSQNNLRLLKNILWSFLVCSLIALATLNTVQRQAEIGILQSVGFGPSKVALLFMLRSFFLGLGGCLLGISSGAVVSHWQSQKLFAVTGKKFEVDWSAGLIIGLVALALSVMAAALPALWSVTQHPADLIGKEG